MTDAVTRQFGLIRQRYAEMDILPNALLSSMTLETDAALSRHLEAMTLRLSAYMLEQQVDEQLLEYPADWWEAVKARWFPAWLLRRYPVRYTRWRASIRAAYPDLTIPNQRTVMVTRFDRPTEDGHE